MCIFFHLELVYEDFNLKSNTAFFYKEDTQAILVSMNRNSSFVLFTDLKAKLIHYKTNSQTKGKVHASFKSLFITGHSLGGALATVAIKRLSHRAGISACYTFGSPRVANKNWIVGIKTPIYRLVNAAPVPMLPPNSS